MESICKHVCAAMEYAYKDYTFDLDERPVEMDRGLRAIQENANLPVLKFKIVKRAKAYTSISVIESDQEVMSYQLVEGKEQILLATPAKIISILHSTDSAIGFFGIT